MDGMAKSEEGAVCDLPLPPATGEFTLPSCRNVVEEICLWAQTRLVCSYALKDASRTHDSLQTQNDGRWSQIRNGLVIGKEIDEFKARVAEAKKLFMVSVRNRLS